jgi:acyl dehydratase
VNFDELTVGASRERVVCPEITRTQIVQFAGASGDFSPLHTDEPKAREAGYPGVLAHGMMVMAASATVLDEWVGAHRLTRYGVRFRHPVLPGDTLTASVRVDAVREAPDGLHVDFTISTTNQDGVEVVRGHAGAHTERRDSGCRRSNTPTPNSSDG